jgi:hypothetical protein
LLIWIIGYFYWITAGFFRVEINFGGEEVLDIAFVYTPEAFFDASAFFCDAFFGLFSELIDAVFDAGSIFQAGGIVVGDFVISSFIADLSEGYDAWQRLRAIACIAFPFAVF